MMGACCAFGDSLAGHHVPLSAILRAVMSGAVSKEARIVNGLGSVLAVIGWIGFVTVLALEIVMLVKVIDASEHL